MFHRKSRYGSWRGSVRWGNARKRQAPPPALMTITGDSARIEGKLEVPASLEVSCDIAGELVVGGRLTIGENGTVRASVRTADAVIKGRFDGDLVATGSVEIAATGRVTGNITTDSIHIARGGFLEGKIRRIPDDQKPQRPRIESRAAGAAERAAARTVASGAARARDATRDAAVVTGNDGATAPAKKAVVTAKARDAASARAKDPAGVKANGGISRGTRAR
jgi:cytoskeletal protein CcmA (bactofilin family)